MEKSHIVSNCSVLISNSFRRYTYVGGCKQHILQTLFLKYVANHSRQKNCDVVHGPGVLDRL